MNYFILFVSFYIQEKRTPLDNAMHNNYTETASLLKECGGDPSIDTKVLYI